MINRPFFRKCFITNITITCWVHYGLRVPPNQRSYAWEGNHVRTLLQDFSNAISGDTKTYFLGTIVLTPSGDTKWEVADGQQRH
ncbi:MAG: DUF262 domain-containing protein [Alphaproteobacteria bacterium]|nr:DUF262 domain-containing protein [Alphaproteobacteria bacterium]